MDVSKIRDEFSSSLLKLDELNKKLIDQISGKIYFLDVKLSICILGKLCILT